MKKSKIIKIDLKFNDGGGGGGGGRPKNPKNFKPKTRRKKTK